MAKGDTVRRKYPLRPTRAYVVTARVKILVHHASTAAEARAFARGLDALGGAGENVCVEEVRAGRARRSPEDDGEESWDVWTLESERERFEAMAPYGEPGC